MSNITYNGWTNYATWRVNLEIFDGHDMRDYLGNPNDTHEFAMRLREFAENIITDYKSETNLAQDYALAFLNDVNWHEIAKNMITDYSESPV